MPQRSLSLKRLFLLALSTYILTWSIVEFERIAWGTGVWLGQFALTWAFVLLLFGLFCTLCLIVIWMVIWTPQRLERILRFVLSFRDRLGPIQA